MGKFLGLTTGAWLSPWGGGVPLNWGSQAELNFFRYKTLAELSLPGWVFLPVFAYQLGPVQKPSWSGRESSQWFFIAGWRDPLGCLRKGAYEHTRMLAHVQCVCGRAYFACPFWWKCRHRCPGMGTMAGDGHFQIPPFPEVGFLGGWCWILSFPKQ